jgi:hypothetical protein
MAETIRKKDYIQDCVFKDFEVKATPGIEGAVKDILDDFLDKDEYGIAICKLLRSEKKKQCVRGMCPLYLNYKASCEIKQLLLDQKHDISTHKTRLDKIESDFLPRLKFRGFQRL